MRMCAEFPEPEPLEVYTDPDNPANSIKTFVALSGFIGDLLQQALCANCTSHTGEKGCMRCCCLGSNTLAGGTGLGTQRMLGMFHCTTATMIEVPEQGGDATLQNRPGLLFAAVQENGDTVFNKQLATEVSISHEQHIMRVRTAEAAAGEARLANPIPPALDVHLPMEQQVSRRAGADPLPLTI